MASSSSTGGRGIAVKQPSAVVGNQFYKEALENASHFNARVVMERKMRLPFLDTLTGVAQTNCSLWMSQSQRRPGIAPGQIYTFPAKRWRKKRRAYFAQVNPPLTQEAAKDATLENALGLDSEAANNLIDSVLKDSEDSKDAVDEIDDIPDAGELEDSSSSDDETYTRRKRKRGGRKKKKEKEEPPPPPDDRDKPYACEWCGKRYKNRPGLNYHYTHFHNGEIPDSGKEEDSPPPRQANGDGDESGSEDIPYGEKRAKGSGPSNYCDFCLGDEKENKKSGMPEELISCSDCGRSGHPTCLQFTPHMTESVKKYRWQCIECKSCHLCGTSENDDQLLFCDDCDRGYHMYCLSPPLSAPPEGSWICKLCEDERKGIIHPPQNGQTVAAPLPHPMP
ncbi:Zinc finger protein ubi-d4 [Branchiostoma belcheri]|nr:Zinc finger protein ubi-d4 [Branchiostoma belcheri]